MEMFTPNLSRWTTDELLSEVLRRTASDAPALEALQTLVIRARLAEGDHWSEIRMQSERVTAPERAGVAGTMELALED